ncbi:MAG: NrsF family protein [Allorhizobium sp.]
MQTSDLINALKADAPKRPPLPLGRIWWAAIVAATIFAAIAFFVLLGPRPDVSAAAHTVRFLFKFAVTLSLAVTAFCLLRTLSRPGSDAKAIAPWLILTPVLVGAAVLTELFVVPADQLLTVWRGSNAVLCMTFIPVIGLAPLGVFLAALSYGAPTRPTFAGAVAGLLAGGLAATFYAAHCPDDSPLFVATWYSIAIVGLAGLGAILGRRIARW